MNKNSTQVEWEAPFPKCDICGLEAHYDVRLPHSACGYVYGACGYVYGAWGYVYGAWGYVYGAWGYVCEKCFKEHGCKLGLGYGQELVKEI